MGEAFLMRRGSGNKNVVEADCALICVKYPAGSTCVCEKDGKTLTSKSTSGVAAFSVPEAGTWTLTITDGEQTASDAVTVAAGDVEIVTLAYTGTELVILSPDDGLADGYSVVSTAAATAQDQQDHPNAAIVKDTGYITPAIDVTNYDTLTITGQTFYTQGGVGTKVFADPDGNSNYSNYAYAFEFSDTLGFAGGTITFDVSQKTGAYYIGQCTGGNSFAFTSIVLS